ncbi:MULTISPECIES: phage tail tape measure protein [unclassified Oceanobacter]|uniref:phage tail tape measure protein n=2 Tax=Gammaproteobacteria TaxID=1236 RepID=UPI00273339BD|nr:MULTISPECIES: phage tail tape measure protein [unclassified Oceanobacter]MDP2607942.1 phage tail tape measure protein [Oceanobacter sp. 1_MG-2023]MDP2611396.1 phage tail tape measure protein [Oceanobacter sp. 2_MG-2023]
MADLTTSIVLSLRNSQFTAGLRSSARQVDQFTTRSSSQIRGLRRDFQSLTGQGFGQLRSELIGLAGGFALVSAARESARLDKSLTEIGLSAGASSDQIRGLRSELFELQKNTGIVVADSQASSGSLLASGLGWNEARGATEAIAPASTVTGAAPAVLAGALSVSSEVFDFDLADVEVATSVLDKMTMAGRTGNAELENLASIFARVGGNAKRAGMDFDQSLGFIEQLSLIERQPERLATLVDSTLRIFTNAKYQQAVEDNLGIQFYDAAGARRDSFDVIDDISKEYQLQKTDRQRDALVADAFGYADLDTQRGIQALLQSGKIDEAREKTSRILAANGTIARELDRAMNNAVIQGQRLSGVLRESVDGFMSAINTGFVEITKFLLDDKKAGGLALDGDDILGGGVALLAGGVAAYKYGGPAMKNLLGNAGNLAGGVAVGAALEATVGVTPVYVVNMPNGISPIGSVGGRGGLPGGAGAPRSGPRVGRSGAPGLPRPAMGTPPGLPAGTPATGMLSMLGWGAAAGAAGYGVGTLINDYLIDGTEVGDSIGRAVANVLAAVGNDTAQAAILSERADNTPRSRSRSEQRAEARLRVEVSDDRTRVTRVDGLGMDVDVSGISMVMP